VRATSIIQKDKLVATSLPGVLKKRESDLRQSQVNRPIAPGRHFSLGGWHSDLSSPPPSHFRHSIRRLVGCPRAEGSSFHQTPRIGRGRLEVDPRVTDRGAHLETLRRLGIQINLLSLGHSGFFPIPDVQKAIHTHSKNSTVRDKTR